MYGPQESDTKERKLKLWDYLNIEVQRASSAGSSITIRMDGNLWAGKDIIEDDPNIQNQNEKLFKDFLQKKPI